jgi:hypothetical protein
LCLLPEVFAGHWIAAQVDSVFAWKYSQALVTDRVEQSDGWSMLKIEKSATFSFWMEFSIEMVIVKWIIKYQDFEFKTNIPAFNSKWYGLRKGGIGII